ncbi:hypothetical protein A3A79_02480 [Candidatus Gottesmanbacteria bacterium RIFCSPLOWO2_01_FULL_43_11b]|uniref:Uncharacterized protein n=1 Tax=Candidatus Gottesmanbacteria bacterium RIFCSPLOWO2_01_FULL_43_11b TaxID=1798392 RepID=A0A1F6AH13_9BACT|nr:MAG: hypothetical protein A3A79_02480 [Candidatus Gottesmanbacteria bacterium RIFCSPLOWO2_01_FULL_43_11b]
MLPFLLAIFIGTGNRLFRPQIVALAVGRVCSTLLYPVRHQKCLTRFSSGGTRRETNKASQLLCAPIFFHKKTDEERIFVGKSNNLPYCECRPKKIFVKRDFIVRTIYIMVFTTVLFLLLPSV